ncbi:MAG: hypothetical protein WBH56_09845 [Bacteroidota bacterium]|jgi:hypothetical protein
MSDRRKLLVHLRRISGVFEKVVRNGPNGSLEGKFQAEHPTFVNYTLGFYLVGCLAYLEGEDGSHSWNNPSQSYSDVDAFAAAHPPPPRESYSARGITKANLDALACIRNAVAHNDGDLAKNRDQNCAAKVVAANLPGVVVNGSVVTLEAAFLEFVRVAALSVRTYYGKG